MRMVLNGLWIAAIVTAVNAQNIVFPDHPDVKNIKTRFGARGDGISDDTQPLTQAVLDGGMIYLPNGTYRVTAPVKGRTSPSAGPWIYGQSRDGVVIRLDDNAAGFGDPGAPQAVISSHGIQTGGAISADFFMRQWHNFTVDAGNNPGAIGIRYYSNNSGVLDNVLIKGNGVYGLDMGWANMNGPCLIHNVTIEGFGVGVYTNHGVNSQTMVGVTIRNCRTIGISATGQNFSVEDLVIENVPVAVDAGCMLVIVNATLKGTDPSKPAVINRAHAYLRAITTQGFSRAVESTTNSGVAGPNVTEYVSHAVVAAFSDFRTSSLMLPIKRSPALQWEQDTSKWVNVQDHGAMPNDRFEDSQAIQAAIDAAAAAGKTTIFFPLGSYTVAASMTVHGSVRHFIGLGRTLIPLSYSFKDRGYGFILREDAAPVVRFENIYGAADLTINSNNSSAIVIDNCEGLKAVGSGSGEIFINNSVGHTLLTNPQARVWARQWNTEGSAIDSDNRGGNLWILGLKTEHGWIKIQTTDGGKSELLGAHIYNICTGTGDNVLFPVVDAYASFACVRETRFCGTPYQQHVRETRGTETKIYRNGVWALFSAAPGNFDPTRVSLEPASRGFKDLPDSRLSLMSMSGKETVHDCRGGRVSVRRARTATGVYIIRTAAGGRRIAGIGR